MLVLIGNAIFLFVLYMIYRDAENRHYKSLQEQSDKLYAAYEELKNFKKLNYDLKEENRRLEKELEIYTVPQSTKGQKELKKGIETFPPEDLISF
jgi:hypothetical protein